MGKRQRNNGAGDAKDLDAKFNVHQMERAVNSTGIGAQAKVLGIDAVQTVIDQFDSAERRILAMTGGVHDPRQRAAAKDFKRKLPRYQSAIDTLENATENSSIILLSFMEIQDFERQLKEHLKNARDEESARQGLPSGRALRKKLGIEKSKKAKVEKLAKSNVVATPAKSKTVQKHSAIKKKKKTKVVAKKDVDMK